MSRREVLVALGASALGVGVLGENRHQLGVGLAALAASRGLLFGTCSKARLLQSDPQLAKLILAHSGVLTADYDFQWISVARDRPAYDFTNPDAFCSWCERHNIRMRAQFIIWRDLLPNWLLQQHDSQAVERILKTHVSTVVGRFSSRIHSWDVVNEAVKPDEERSDGLRPGFWLDRLGARHIPLALALVREHSPRAEIVINEDRLQVRGEDRRRARMLQLLTELLDEGVPVDTLGVQGHLRPGFDRVDEVAYREFLASVAGLGLRVSVTELDVADDHLSADIDRRDHEVAAAYKQFLDVTLDEPAVQSVQTWGLCDDQSWYSWRLPRADGRPVRPLPFDSTRNAKTAVASIAQSLASAPQRSLPAVWMR
jgi:endo-1,4-beta-xylanase